MSKKFDINYVCSLGPRCHTACLLKKNNMKKASYPFDWIFTNIDMILHCLEDDFQIFLDESYFTIKDKSSTIQQHSYYCENNEDHVFNHRNPLIKKDYNYYVRCIQRFKSLLKKKENKLFVLLFLNYTKIDYSFKKKIIDFNAKLKKFTDFYGILCIVQYLGDGHKYQFSIYENVHFLEIYTKTKSNGIEFENPEDNIFLDKIIMSTYSFHLYEVDPIFKMIDKEEKEEKEEKEKETKEDNDTNKLKMSDNTNTDKLEQLMEKMKTELIAEFKTELNRMKIDLKEELKMYFTFDETEPEYITNENNDALEMLAALACKEEEAITEIEILNSPL